MVSRRFASPYRMLALALSVALIAAACSGDGDEGVETDASAAEEPTAEPDTVDTEGSDNAEDPTDEATVDDGEAVDPNGAADPEDDTPAAGPTPTPGDDVDLTQPAFTASSKVSTVGLDEVFFGMSVADAAGAAGTAWAEPTGGGQLCYFVTPQNGPPGVSFLVWGGFVEAVFIETDLITTRSGAGVGSSEAQLQELFGEQLLIAPAPNGEGNWAQFVPLEDGDDTFRVVFETDGDRVTSYRSGRVPQVVDGCADN